MYYKLKRLVKSFHQKGAVKVKSFLGFFICFMLYFQVGAQLNVFNDSLRVHFILDIAKYVHWQSEDTINTFKIGILSKDSALFREFKNPHTKSKVHKKPLKVLRFSRTEDITHTQVLFVKNNKAFDVDEILQIIHNKNILLIGEHYEFHKTMINFVIANNNPRFEVNEMLLNRERLSVTPLFLGLAVKTEADWKLIFQKTQEELQVEKLLVKNQNEDIKKQKQEIEKQRELINSQHSEIISGRKELKQQKSHLDSLMRNTKAQETLLKQNTIFLQNREAELSEQRQEMIQQEAILHKQKAAIETQENKIDEQKTVLNKQLAQIKMQKLILYLFIAIILIIVAMIFFIYRSYKTKKHANALLAEKNEAISRQNAEILEQKEEITDSIQYARRIQNAILPPPEMIENLMPGNFFILNKPRDIVSGDYYWMSSHGKKMIIAAADCTGHGVPGAFMSMLGMAYMNEIINKNKVLIAGEILNQLRDNVINALHQSDENAESKDGMDMALVVLDTATLELQFAGANNPLYIIKSGNLHSNGELPELIEIKGDKMPIGIHDRHHPFNSNLVKLQKGDTFYLFSDGYADQFGGDDEATLANGGKKFKYKKLKELLQEIQSQTMTDQMAHLDKTIINWQGPLPQIDDILVIGIRV